MLDFLNKISFGLIDNINELLVVSVILLLIVYFYVLWNIRNEWYEAIRGYWAVDPEFAKISSLSSGGLIIDNYFALDLDNGKGGISTMLDEKDFSLNVDWWLIPTFNSRKFYSMKVNTTDIDKLGNFFDSDEMKKNICIEVENGTLYLYCHDTLYLKAIRIDYFSDIILKGCQPNID